MSIISGINDFFGLDLGTSAIRLVQLRHSPTGHGPASLIRYGQTPIDTRLALSDSKADQQKVMQSVKQLINQAQLNTKNVAVGLPSHKVFTTVVDMDRLSADELAKTITYQADAIIPTPVTESKIDWALLGDSPKDKTKIEVLVTSVTNSFAEARLDILESIGLNVIAFEPDGFALLRALVPSDDTAPVLILDVGKKAADLVIAFDNAPRLIRSIPTGLEAVIKAAAQTLGITDEQANQFIFKFGLTPDKLEGQVRAAILPTIDLLTSEIDKSIKFFQTRYSDKKLQRIILSGGTTSLPEFPQYIAGKFNVNVEIGNAWRNIAFDPARQNELLALSNQFGVAAGLAERKE